MKLFLSIFFNFCLSITYAQIEVSTLVNNINASGGVKIDTKGNIFVADFGESLDNGNGTNVYKITPNGEVSLFATGLSGASGNAFDSQGNLFQSNIQAGVVSKITPDGVVSTFTSSGISCNVGIAIDPEDNLYVCNCCGTFGNTIRKVTPDGASMPFASGSLFNCPNGLTIDKDNNLYASNFSNGNIIKITPDGTASLFARTPGAGGNNASNGHIVYSPQEDVLYVASHGAHRIYRLDMEGHLEIFAGTSVRGNRDGEALEATFSRPNGLALSLTGDTLYLNSSIPLTNVGGRPLNPSRIRMITGLLNMTSSNPLLKEELHVQISPNPSSDKIQVHFNKSSNKLLTMNLLNTTGQLLKEIKKQQYITTNQQLNLDLSNLSQGVYFLHFYTSTESFIKKIVKQ